ncbi:MULTISPECIES: hypothetical protein [Pseudoalteromonas]|uniref:Uncharacterized protein n=1 Tax=Pseudoalteromonas lipolytica TaxID=570156 RepID=A0A0P7E9L1_9GAMM|nr:MULTISPECIES: hypothetical protein [Pseudoalteromonas]KPM84764.1 hypothetical protein AOG27_02950 [Pseudoalteromonas lipolytica]NHH89703.1 hypothetical protein [Pseudoalteromonas sp. MB47]TMP48054.1 hypothetical protein CWB80_04440 [Pseudoalteromonas sp. S1650]TMP66266.1 hypothetical protein CWB79_12175 [Pseudoalteromonas sp. S1649]|tara:strand:+ start:1043 stop:1441 length:399 start_codon:yes stop_codon:yes gene_type:complete
MKNKNILTALGLALITLNSGHSFGAVVEPPYNDTQLVVALFKCILFVLPSTTLLLVLWSHWKHLRFKQLLQTVLNYSLVIMLASLIMVNHLTAGLSSWLVVFAGIHSLLVGINYLLVKQHTNRIKNTLTSCW